MLHEITFYLIAALTLAAAITAMTLRNLVHCALSAAGAFVGLAVVYLQLDAEFVGFSQLLVYVGAIAILIVFTVLLTRGVDVKADASANSPHWLTGIAVTALVLGCLVTPILKSPSLRRDAPPEIAAPVKEIGGELMTRYVLPLETIGLLLTVALLGAVVIAMHYKPEAPQKRISRSPKRKVLEEVSLR